MICRSLFVLLAIVLSILRFTTPFYIFKLSSLHVYVLNVFYDYTEVLFIWYNFLIDLLSIFTWENWGQQKSRTVSNTQSIFESFCVFFHVYYDFLTTVYHDNTNGNCSCSTCDRWTTKTLFCVEDNRFHINHDTKILLDNRVGIK